MIHPCGTCGCDSQQGATVVAMISVVHFLIQLVMFCVFGQQSSGVTPDGKVMVAGASNDEYYVLIATHILLIVVSFLLFVGVRYKSIFMILPWVVMTSIADIGYAVMMIGALVLTIGHYHVYYLTGLLATIFLFTLVSYFLWIVIVYLLELLAQRNTYQQFGADSDESVKMTPVKKYIVKP